MFLSSQSTIFPSSVEGKGVARALVGAIGLGLLPSTMDQTFLFLKQKLFLFSTWSNYPRLIYQCDATHKVGHFGS